MKKKIETIEVLFNKELFTVQRLNKSVINSREVDRLLKSMTKLIGHQAKQLCGCIDGYQDEYLEVWNLLAETAIHLLGQFNPKKAQWNTYFYSYASRQVKRILMKTQAYKIKEYLYEDLYGKAELIVDED